MSDCMKNFTLIYGLDKALIKNEIEKIRKQLNTSNIIKYSFGKDSLEDILLDASLVSMFGEKKFIVVWDASFFSSSGKNDDSLKMLQYFEHYNSDTYLVFVCLTEKVDTRKKIYKKIKEIGTVIEVTSKDDRFIREYVFRILKENHYVMKDLSYFLDKVGTNIDNIQNELDKLFMYTIDEKNITKEDIDKLIVPFLEDEIFALTDAVIRGDTDRSLELLEEFLNKGYDEMQILVLLASQFRFMFQVKRLSSKNFSNDQISKELSANPYRVKKTIQNCYYYSDTDLLLYLKKLAELDKNIKLGKFDKNLGLQLFLMNKDYRENDE